SRSSVNHIESTDSTIYFGTFNEGIKCLDFRDLQQEPLGIPILTITKLRINNRDYPLSDSIHELNHDEDFLQISYVGTSYQAGNVVYRYRLNGLRDNWTTTEETYTQFTSLPPGDYAFEIQAQKEEQVWSASKFIRFRIAPPFWLTWWFIVASALGATALAYAIISYRIAMINREKSLIIKRLTAEQKALSAKMDQHLIFNIISSAQYLISEGLNEKADHFLEKFAGLMRKTLDQTNRQSVSIEDEIHFLMEYLEMEQLRLEGQFKYQLTVDPTLRLTERIPNFIVQPIVENAIEHGIKNKPEKGMVSVQFLLRDQLLKVVIEDNGVGYNQSRQDQKARHVKRESHGIATIRERLKLHNGKIAEKPVVIRDLSLEGPDRSGTQVTLSITLSA
ncbi:MAG: histidine kinase, partial [Bacteroidota bacterium]